MLHQYMSVLRLGRSTINPATLSQAFRPAREREVTLPDPPWETKAVPLVRDLAGY
jgi:hypothetical protein